ncbi:MAG: hypothetical protein KF763_12960 [Cyclobacteriaceae bacterium]|nr:hypothetical protein [Cyclobacteriaceae bacterium]
MFDNKNIRFYNWPEFHYIELELNISFSALLLLSRNNEEILNHKMTELENAIKNDNLLSSLDGSDGANYFSQQYEYSVMTIKEISQKQRFAMVLTIFATIENHLKRIIGIVETRRNSKIKLNTSLSKIQNYYNFLAKEFSITSESIISLFTMLNDQRHIRNAIAHGDGSITGTQIANTDYGISVAVNGDSKQLIISESIYVEYLLKTSQDFLDKLLFEINSKTTPIQT